MSRAGMSTRPLLPRAQARLPLYAGIDLGGTNIKAALVDDEIVNANDHIKVVALMVMAGTHGPQSAALTLDIDGEKLTHQATGNGPVDAIFNAIRALAPHEATLELFLRLARVLRFFSNLLPQALELPFPVSQGRLFVAQICVAIFQSIDQYANLFAFLHIGAIEIRQLLAQQLEFPFAFAGLSSSSGQF